MTAGEWVAMAGLGGPTAAPSQAVTLSLGNEEDITKPSAGPLPLQTDFIWNVEFMRGE